MLISRLPRVLTPFFLLAGLAFTGCETTNGGGASTPTGAAVTALPLNVLDEMYRARTAMTSLADGSAENPAAAAAAVANAIPLFNTFSERLDRLDRSFNSNDYRALWDQLEGMGSMYQFNTIGFSASELRWMESYLTPFRNNVANVRRIFNQYHSLYQQLMQVVGDDVSPQALQNNIPLVNQLTTVSINLDSELRTFSEQLRALSRELQEASVRGG